jgi:hypothetical protein
MPAYAAAAGGHVAVLSWLLSQQPPCPIDAMSTMVAAKAGNIEVSSHSIMLQDSFKLLS